VQTKALLLAACALVGAVTPRLAAYDLIRSGQNLVKWPAGSVPMQVKLGSAQTLQDGTNYSSSFVAALDAWNAVVRDVQFAGTVGAAGAGGDGNRVNEVFFSANVYGQAWGSTTLAVTTTEYSTTQPLSDGSYRRTEADILFNSGRTWNSYRGALQSGTVDLRRVAVHELGHALGLDHPDEAGQTVTAIMNSHISDVDALQRDDLDGAQRLYGVPGVALGPVNDLFVNATNITLPNNNTVTLTGTSVGASKETGEPNHASGEAGGASVWWKWTANTNGTLIVSTNGSNFDTLLGAYTGSAVATLTQVASNDDIEPPPTSGTDSATRNRRSLVTFNAVAGTTYYFAVDGWEAEWGTITLTVTLSPTDPLSAPVFTAHPASQTVTVGNSAIFTAAVVANPTPTYQWSKNGAAIAGATSSNYSISNVQASDAGSYTVTATNSQGSTTSNVATLTVNPVVTTPTSTSSGGGGGGGGAPSAWFLAALALAGVARRLTRRQ